MRMLPRAADVLRERIRGGNLGLRDPRSIIPARNALFAMFGGKVPLRAGRGKAREQALPDRSRGAESKRFA